MGAARSATMKRSLMLGMFVFFMASTAHALPAGEAPLERVVQERETYFEFDGEDLTGRTLGPMYMNVHGHREIRMGSLIQIRRDFVAEMIKSVEHL
jgi:hypothetical protein